MLISTRGRYALRVLGDLAQNGGEAFVPLKEVAARQDISLKYLESIMTALGKGGLVETAHGKRGGYRLRGGADTITVGQVLRLCEGDLAPVGCLQCGDEAGCDRAGLCVTHPMWTTLDRMVNAFFDGITLAQLVDGTFEAPVQAVLQAMGPQA